MKNKYIIYTCIRFKPNCKRFKAEEMYNDVYHSKEEAIAFLKSEGFKRSGALFRHKIKYKYQKGFFYEFAKLKKVVNK